MRGRLTVKMQDVVYRRCQRPQACLDVIDPGLQFRLVRKRVRQEPGKKFQTSQRISNLMGEQGGNLCQRLGARVKFHVRVQAAWPPSDRAG